MKYGCIGEHLKHSFSKEIHNTLTDYEYEIKEIPKDNLDAFMVRKDFRAINVTIPYKELVIPHLNWIDEHAKEIGAVNTIVNRNGKLYGYNTDFYGMAKLIHRTGIVLKNKKVAVLGTGGTSKTAIAVSKSMQAKEVLVVSRRKSEGCIDYQELYEKYNDIDVIINTTPCGMYPNVNETPVDLSKFKNVNGVIDAVYNPLRTRLVLSAKNKGILAEGGLYMLVAQGVRASEIFLDKEYDDLTSERVYEELKNQKENIVLIGMPSSGKSTVGNILAEKLGRAFIDTDKLIEESRGISVAQIIQSEGIDCFRAIEHEVVEKVSSQTGVVIATGGGVILNEENMKALSLNGKIYFIDRPLSALTPTEDRPLSRNKEEITKRYYERYEIYKSWADISIDADCDAEEVSEKIMGENKK